MLKSVCDMMLLNTGIKWASVKRTILITGFIHQLFTFTCLTLRS